MATTMNTNNVRRTPSPSPSSSANAVPPPAPSSAAARPTRTMMADSFSSTSAPARRSAAAAPAPAMPASVPTFDGSSPAAGTTSTNAALPVNPPVTGDPDARSRDTYDNVINQFAVGVNPRYAQRDSSGDGFIDTFCNIFVSDVTAAMGAPIPHWVDGQGNPTPPGVGGELDANATARWLRSDGAAHGWRRVSESEAQALANQGHPVVAAQETPGSIGHIGVVRPGQALNGPALAQAGAQNFNQGHVYDTFTPGRVEYWANDAGTASTSPAPPGNGSPGAAPSSAPSVDLGRGATGAAVEQLQKGLVSLGFMSQADMNTGPGTFGPKTEAAVRSFQSAHGVSATGFYGPLTRAALTTALAQNAPPSTTPPSTTPPSTTPPSTTPPSTPPSTPRLRAPAAGLGIGSTGPGVEQLQRGLVALGFMTQADMNTGPGTFGPRTQSAVRAFQGAHGVSTTGFYGPMTKAALDTALRDAPSAGAPATGSGTGAVGAPQGAIETVNGNWADVNRWDSIVNAASAEFGVPADLLKAMIVIESRGNPNAYRPDDGWGGGPAVGLMQIKPAYWGNLVPGADAYTPEGNVRIAAQLLRNAYDQHGSWDGALTNVYFPADDPNGTSQADYLALVRSLRAEINAA